MKQERCAWCHYRFQHEHGHMAHLNSCPIIDKIKESDSADKQIMIWALNNGWNVYAYSWGWLWVFAQGDVEDLEFEVQGSTAFPEVSQEVMHWFRLQKEQGQGK